MCDCDCSIPGHTRLLYDHLTSSMPNDLMKTTVDKCCFRLGTLNLFSYATWLKSYLKNCKHASPSIGTDVKQQRDFGGNHYNCYLPTKKT